MAKDMDTIVSLAKHRGFVFPGSDIYGIQKYGKLQDT